MVEPNTVEIIFNGTLLVAEDFALFRGGLTAWITETEKLLLVEADILSKVNRISLNDTILSSTSIVVLRRSRSNWDSAYVTGAYLSRIQLPFLVLSLKKS